MAPSESPSVVEPRDLAVSGMIEQPQAQAGFGRNFGFLVHDVSRLIKRRFDLRCKVRERAQGYLRTTGTYHENL